MGEGFTGTTIKDTWKIPKGGRIKGGDGCGGRKMETTVLEQQ